MKLKSLITAVSLAGLFVASAQAQFIGGLAVNPQTAKAGEPVTVTATIDVTSSNFCGFIVFFGDGTSVEGVSDAKTTPPYNFAHTYAKAGQYTLSMGGRHVQSHPNCTGTDKMATVTITEAPKPIVSAPAAPAPAAKPVVVTAANVCPENWKVVPKSFNAKSGAFSCSAKPGTALPAAKAICPGDLTYFENAKKGQFGCRK
jgi:hypothetical protein